MTTRKKNAKYKEAYSRQILYSARRRALAGSARERRDMGHGPLAQGPSVFSFSFFSLFLPVFFFSLVHLFKWFFWFLIFQRISYLNNFQILNTFLIWIHFNFEQNLDIEKNRILNKFLFEQIWDLNKF
jgi:hypothetical protein